MRECGGKIRFSVLICVVTVSVLVLGLATGCGGNKKVEFSISPSGLSRVENAAPKKDYALYVAAASVPGSAGDLAVYAVVQCITGETAVNRAMAVQTGIVDGAGSGGSSSINIYPAGDGTADGIKKALAGELTSGAKCVVLVKRGSPVPADAVEVVLK